MKLPLESDVQSSEQQRNACMKIGLKWAERKCNEYKELFGRYDKYAIDVLQYVLLFGVRKPPGRKRADSFVELRIDKRRREELYHW